MRRFLFAIGAFVVGSLAESTTARADAGSDGDDEGLAALPSDTGVPGPRIVYSSPPIVPQETKACSMRSPVCVHATGTANGRAALDVLAAADRAWGTLTGALGLPPPDLDDRDLRYHVYLVEGASEPARTLVSARDVRSKIDRARAFTVLDANVRSGCIADAVVTREIARAILYRVAPATAEGVARAQTTYLAELIVPCASAFADAARAFQSQPQRAVCDGDATASLGAAGASLFWGRIDWAYGRSPGATVMATWAFSTTNTELGRERWHDEPDAFDVLQSSFKNALSTGSTVNDLLLDTSIARAFMGSADDGQHHPETRTLGDDARVPFDWDLPWPQKPTRLAPRAPVEPTGASYVLIRRAGAPPKARLRVELAWEEHALFRWAFVKLDASGREIGRVVLPTRERATEVQMTLVDLEGVDRILLVGTNVGDPAYRFDPDDEVWEPHGWLLTVAAE